jgi:uncharacterized membrane protein
VNDEGSTIPLILGFVLLAMFVVAGSVAAGDAFVQQGNLQSVCDGAAADAAASIDANAQRSKGDSSALRLGGVQSSVRAYLAREPDRSDIRVASALSADAGTVSLACERRETIAFGALFGFGGGIDHHVTSTARAPVID